MIILFYFYDFNCAMVPEKRKQKRKKRGAIGVGSLFSYFRLYFSLLVKRQKTQNFVSCVFSHDTPLVTNRLCVCAFIEPT